jgi:hypothetical protein
MTKAVRILHTTKWDTPSSRSGSPRTRLCGFLAWSEANGFTRSPRRIVRSRPRFRVLQQTVKGTATHRTNYRNWRLAMTRCFIASLKYEPRPDEPLSESVWYQDRVRDCYPKSRWGRCGWYVVEQARGLMVHHESSCRSETLRPGGATGSI